jgi:hypothetical protein
MLHRIAEQDGCVRQVELVHETGAIVRDGLDRISQTRTDS